MTSGHVIELDLGCPDSLTQLAANTPTIAAHTQGIWLLKLSAEDALLGGLWPLLSEDERARAQAFRVDHAKRQYVQVRAVLRLLLGYCLGRASAELEFCYSSLNKPALAGHGDWHFNVSHSGHYALLCIAHGREVGVDIEQYRTPSELVAMLKMVLSPAEMAYWWAQPADERIAAFFATWTAKEAVAKAVGQGLRLDFSSLTVGELSGASVGEVRRVDVEALGACQLTILPAPSGYAAALAVRLG